MSQRFPSAIRIWGSGPNRSRVWISQPAGASILVTDSRVAMERTSRSTCLNRAAMISGVSFMVSNPRRRCFGAAVLAFLFCPPWHGDRSLSELGPWPRTCQ